MSRIGKLPIEITEGVTIEISKENLVTVKGSKGELSEQIHPNVKIEKKDNQIIVSISTQTKFDKSLWGLSRTLIANMIEGVTKGYEKKLEIIGVGYRAQVQGKKLTLSLGFSHPIEYQAPEGITFEIDKDKKNILSISGINKRLVGQVSAEIRSYRKPEPYKGKGIKYIDEEIARKAGKTAAKAA